MELSIEPDEWVRGLYTPFLEVADGKATVPDSPGWGVRISQRWLEVATRSISET
jgi:L-alanine-DL-glutamate epimerase-like enolase superfamily enzyme